MNGPRRPTRRAARGMAPRPAETAPALPPSRGRAAVLEWVAHMESVQRRDRMPSTQMWSVGPLLWSDP
jgi:hypothetical protein